MRWKRKRTIVVLACLAIGSAMGGVAIWLNDYPVHHFSVVREGVLYRSGQPDPGQLRRLVDRYGIRTVVNLRGQRTEDVWWRGETAFCNKRVLHMKNIEMGEGAAALANIGEFLDIVGDPANRPVLVHCEAGSARTGFAVAAYRIVVDGWSYEKAMDEALTFHFKMDHSTNKEYQQILRHLADARVQGGTTFPGSQRQGKEPRTEDAGS
ncbi:MAG: tyrosine-protein phosphatase [Planctomycetota bacterium]